jgi:hypothetical protein
MPTARQGRAGRRVPRDVQAPLFIAATAVGIEVARLP